MDLVRETWETMIEALQNKITNIQEQNNSFAHDLARRSEDLEAIGRCLVAKCNEITELKAKLRVYENKDKRVSHQIRTL